MENYNDCQDRTDYGQTELIVQVDLSVLPIIRQFFAVFFKSPDFCNIKAGEKNTKRQ